PGERVLVAPDGVRLVDVAVGPVLEDRRAAARRRRGPAQRQHREASGRAGQDADDQPSPHLLTLGVLVFETGKPQAAAAARRTGAIRSAKCRVVSASSTRRRPAAPRRRASSSSCTTRSIAAASASGSSGGTRSAVSPSVT